MNKITSITYKVDGLESYTAVAIFTRANGTSKEYGTGGKFEIYNDAVPFLTRALENRVPDKITLNFSSITLVYKIS